MNFLIFFAGFFVGAAMVTACVIASAVMTSMNEKEANK